MNEQGQKVHKVFTYPPELSQQVNDWAGGMKAPAPMLGQALSLYRLAASHGYSELDSSAVVKIYK